MHPMRARPDEVFGGAAGLIGALVVGAAVLFSGAGVGDSTATTVVWWSLYVIYVLVFAIECGFLPVPGAGSELGRFVVLAICGSAVFLLAPHLGWTAVLFVVTTATSAFVLPSWAVALVVAAHTVVVAAGSAAIEGTSVASVVFNTLAYAAFMSFAAVVVISARREHEARAELAAAHADLRAATALLATSSRDAERLRIARDLHDLVGHQLTALALDLEVIALQSEGETRERVLQTRQIAKDLLSDVRAAVGELRSEPAGLEPTLRKVVAGIPGLTIDLRVDEQCPPGERAALAVVRCVQEVVTNTLRHADATRLDIAVTSDVDGLVLTARDDGAGVTELRPGNGLTGMTERIEELGGTLDLRSRRGAGFIITARVPA